VICVWLASKEGYEFLFELTLVFILVYHPVTFLYVYREGETDALENLEEGSLQGGCSHYLF